MKYSLLGMAAVAVFFSSCAGNVRQEKKENNAAVNGVEEIDVLEILPERKAVPAGAVSNGTVHAADADQTLVQGIRRALANDEILARYVAIRVTTKNGEVVLRGFVDSIQDKAAVEKKVHAITGVKRVDNQLEVTPIPAINAPAIH